jgi:hypothetical protein
MRWLSDEEIAAYEAFDFRSLTRSLGPIQKQVGKALPGAAQGAAMGSVLGPWGALAGGAAGALGLVQGPGKGAQPSAAQAPAAPPGDVPAATAMPNASAAGQLSQFLQNPALLQAVTSLAAGQGGANASGLPPGALLNVLGTLANNAAYEAEAELGERDDSYLRGADGSLIVDPSSPAERAAVTWSRLQAMPGFESAEDDPGESLVEAGIAQRLG